MEQTGQVVANHARYNVTQWIELCHALLADGEVESNVTAMDRWRRWGCIQLGDRRRVHINLLENTWTVRKAGNVLAKGGCFDSLLNYLHATSIGLPTFGGLLKRRQPYARPRDVTAYVSPPLAANVTFQPGSK